MPAWSPDGQTIAYAASPLSGGSFDIWGVAARGGSARSGFVGGPAEQVAPRWSRTGRLTELRLEPGDPFPEPRRETPTRRRPGRASSCPTSTSAPRSGLTMCGHEARLRLCDRQRRRRADPDRGSRISTGAPMLAQQLVQLSDGSVRTYAGVGRLRYTPESTHTHWHLLDFQRYELRRADGTLVVRDRKSGFCLADHYGYAARRVAAFRGPRFLGNCASSQPSVLSVEQGTSSGYTDLYPPHFHGQNLELRGVPAGIYVLVHRANPEDRLEELDYSNNAASLRIRLSWSGQTPRVETLRTCEGSERC